MSAFFNSYRTFAWSVGRRWLSSECFEKSSLETERIRTVSPQSVHWFPGHMHKGMEVIHSKLPLVDIIIEVHDARIPFSGRPEFFQKFEMIPSLDSREYSYIVQLPEAVHLSDLLRIWVRPATKIILPGSDLQGPTGAFRTPQEGWCFTEASLLSMDKPIPGGGCTPNKEKRTLLRTPTDVSEFGCTRPTILLLNKVDLAEKVTDRETYKARILEASKIVNRSPIEVYYTQLNAPEKQKRTLKRIMSSLPHLAASAGSIINSTITLMVVGIPNSGKSTLINALRGIGRGGPGGATRVGRNAGQTRSVGQPIILCRGQLNNMVDEMDYHTNSSDDYRIQVFDTPGILEPRAQTLAERLSLCVCGAVDLNSVQQGKCSFPLTVGKIHKLF
ncbi:unnamed protein product [Trichobilharzia regenti]|nr:unnamed protein product [Trichobilharzia regenti]